MPTLPVSLVSDIDKLADIGNVVKGDCPVWSWINPKNLMDWQRDAAFRYLGEEARRLLAAGYPVEADRLLDELAERFPDRIAA